MDTDTDTRQARRTGDSTRRIDPRDHYRWGAAAWSGILAGLAFMMLEMVMVTMFLAGSPWGPPRMMAAMALGPSVLPPPATFALVPMMVAMMIHIPLSGIYGLVIAAIVQRMGLVAALATGAAFGLLAVYLVNFYLLAPMLFPWFTEAQNWVSAFAHAMFGLVAAGLYVGLRNREG